jgi:DNA-binding transcriptional ArsR family regulator
LSPRAWGDEGFRGNFPLEGVSNARVTKQMSGLTQVDRALDALGDPTRRVVFRRLRRGNRSVREIADGMDVSRPAVSQHLKVLKAAGLVVLRIEGARRLYGVEALRNWLDGF